jgi:hypothetical protein
MNARDELLEALAVRRRHMLELAETQLWVHHVADLTTGKTETTVLDRPITTLSRVQRLSIVDAMVDTSIFGGPSYRLTARRPYQESPLAHLIAGNSSGYNTWDNDISWQLPRNLGVHDSTNAMRFFFQVSPDRRSVVSISCSGRAFQGTTGHVNVNAAWSPAEISFPFSDHFAHHTIDLVFVPLGGRESDIFMWLQTGIEFFTFESVSFYPEPPVLQPLVGDL